MTKIFAAACLIALTLGDACQAQLFRRITPRTTAGVSSNGNVTGYTSDGKAIWTDYRGRQAYYAGQCCSNVNCKMRQKLVAALNATQTPLTSNASSRNAVPNSNRIQPTGQQYTTKTEMREQTYQVKVCRNGVCRYETRTRMVPVQVRVPVKSNAVPAGGDDMGVDLLISEMKDANKRKSEQAAREAAMQAVKLEDVPTPQAVIETIYDLWQLPAGSWVCEPCAGSAPFLREGIRRGYQAMGVELNPDTARKTNAELEGGYVLVGDVKDYLFDKFDAVFLYAYRPEMEHVLKSVKRGCRVASFQNPLPGMKSRKILLEVDGETVAVYLGVKS